MYRGCIAGNLRGTVSYFLRMLGIRNSSGAEGTFALSRDPDLLRCAPRRPSDSRPWVVVIVRVRFRGLRSWTSRLCCLVRRTADLVARVRCPWRVLGSLISMGQARTEDPSLRVSRRAAHPVPLQGAALSSGRRGVALCPSRPASSARSLPGQRQKVARPSARTSFDPWPAEPSPPGRAAFTFLTTPVWRGLCPGLQPAHDQGRRSEGPADAP